MRAVRLLLLCCGTVTPHLAGQVTPPPDSASTAADTLPIYSSRQARRGQSIYDKRCVNCHSAAAYTGVAFRRAWGNRSVYELWEQIRTTMPQDSPGGLAARDYADIVAYLLKLNKLPAGDRELPSTAAELRPLVIRVPQPGG